MFKSSLALVALIATLTAFSTQAQEVTIYSTYDAKRLAPVFEPFTKQTGIKVNIIDAESKTLVDRIASEGTNTNADLHLDKDLVFNAYATSLNIYQPFKSKTVESVIPSYLIEKNKEWYTFLYRARVIIYNKKNVQASELSTLEDLASAKWKNRLCLRTSTNSYNQALGAYVLKHNGANKALTIFQGWVNNLALAPLKNDREVIHAVAEGKCDVGIANTYYLAPIVEADPQFAAAAFFPDQKTVGSHINGISIGITKYSKNVKNATLVMEYLTTLQVQEPLAKAFDQYPSNKNAPLAQTLKDFGTFKEDETNIGEIGNFVNEANELMIKAQYK